jgi:hypothetical protein
MTLVLHVATPVHALHVSDRLVSKAEIPHDPLANKTVVLRATDGLLAFGYTGPAYVSGVPMDTWIADAVSGGSCAADMGSLAYGNFPVRDVGTSLLALSQGLRGIGPFRRDGAVSGVGWQWDGERDGALVRHVLWGLDEESGKFHWQQAVPRHLPEREKASRITRAGAWPLTSEEWRRLVDQVAAAGPDVGLVESLLVDAIRRASDERPGLVGKNCMSVLLRPWENPNVHVRFIPDDPHEGKALGQTLEVAFSPWLVAPDAIIAPSLLVGGITSGPGLLTYSMDAPPVPEDQRLKAALQSQKRRAP